MSILKRIGSVLSSSAVVLTAAVLSLSVSACSNGADTSAKGNASLQDASDAVIGDVKGNSPLLEAVGSIGTVNADGKFQFLCTASLIGPTTVLTAKHCVQTSSGLLFAQTKTFFAVGNSLTPSRLVQIVAGTMASLNEGGFYAVGSDIAALNLVESITDIAPLAIGERSLGADDLGRRFLTAGFGAASEAELNGGAAPNGERSAGTLEARASSGKSFELLFGSYEAFKQYFVDLYGQEYVDYYAAEFQAYYDETLLLDGYEFFLGGSTSDARLSEGDQGGPLLLSSKSRTGGTTVQLFGVLSDTFANDTKSFGSFFATFGPAAREAIAKAQAWVDPCIGESVAGRCDGTIAIRCTDISEGPRSVSSFDCADMDLVCNVDEAGAVSCGDPQIPQPNE